MDREAPERNFSSLNDSPQVSLLRKGSPGKEIQVSLSDGSSFFVSPGVVSELDLFEGRTLDTGEYQRLLTAAREIEAEKKVMDLLSRAEQCRFGLTQKLYKKGFSRDITRTVLDKCEKQGFLDDRRYAEAWVRSRMRRRPEGRAALLAGLRSRGISMNIAEEIVGFLVSPEEETEAMKKTLEKLTRSGGKIPREKLVKKLLRRGFPLSMIKSVLPE